MPDTVARQAELRGEAELRRKSDPAAAVELSAFLLQMLHTASRVYAAIAEKRGEVLRRDLIEHGFAPDFLERHWARISADGDRVAAERRERGR